MCITLTAAEVLSKNMSHSYTVSTVSKSVFPKDNCTE